MAVSEVLLKYKAEVEPTVSLASIANGAGRICAVLDNTTTRASRWAVFAKIKVGTTPTANTPVKYYYVPQSNGTNNVKAGGGALGDVDAAVSTEPVNCYLIGAIVIPVTTSNASYSELVGYVYDPAPKGSIVVWNATGVALNATPDTPALQVVPMTDEGQ